MVATCALQVFVSAASYHCLPPSLFNIMVHGRWLKQTNSRAYRYQSSFQSVSVSDSCFCFCGKCCSYHTSSWLLLPSNSLATKSTASCLQCVCLARDRGMKVFAAYFPLSQVCMYFRCLCFSAYPFSNSYIESAVCRQSI